MPHAVQQPHPIATPLGLACGAVLSNRIAKAALSEQLADRENAPTERLAELYRRWSAGGAGLLVTGNVMVDRSAVGEPANVIVDDARHLDRLRAWAAASDGTDTDIWVQLNHPGRQAPRYLAPQPVAPSAVPMHGSRRSAFARPRALTPGEVEAIIDRFANTAAIVRDAGFAGVQLHGAHGYLISQFLSPRTNLRTDSWGGDPERRMRFLLELVRATREAVGPGFPIGVKLNSADFQRGGFTEDDSIQVACALEAAGVDLLEVSGGTYERSVMMTGEKGAAADPAPPVERESTRRREAYFLDYTRRLREAVRMPLMLTGGFRSAAAMREAVANGDIDVVGLGRPLTVDPDLPRGILDGTSQGSTVRPVTAAPFRTLDGLAEIVWHAQQMHRLAAGRSPAPRRTVTRALAQAVVTNGANALRRTRG